MQKRRTHGFTLVEMVLAMAVTAIVGLSVAGVSIGLSNSYANSEDYYDALQGGRSVLMQAQSLGRTAQLVTATATDSVVFWACDTNADGKINRNELTMIYWDRSGNDSVVRMERISPAATSVVVKDQVMLNTASSVASVSSLLSQYSQYRENSPLACDVLDFKVIAPTAAPKTTLLQLEITVGRKEHPLTLRSTVSLRAGDTANVGKANNQWVLTTETP